MDESLDVEGAMRTWLRNHPVVGPLVKQHVFFAIPKGDPPFPLIVVMDVGGGPEDGEAPLEGARISLACWADTKHGASKVARSVVAALQNMSNESLDDSVFGYGASGINKFWFPDPTDDYSARYMVDATVTARARQAA